MAVTPAWKLNCSSDLPPSYLTISSRNLTAKLTSAQSNSSLTLELDHHFESNSSFTVETISGSPRHRLHGLLTMVPSRVVLLFEQWTRVNISIQLNSKACGHVYNTIFVKAGVIAIVEQTQNAIPARRKSEWAVKTSGNFTLICSVPTHDEFDP